MDLLRREWIGPTIERGLNDGLAWLFKKPADLVDQHKSACSRFEDDDSNLRVHVPKSGVVQIAKLLTFHDPIEAWVSDSKTRVRAIFATLAVQKYEQEARKKITQDTLGGLIQILEFEIVATHLGPKSLGLKILINQFKYLGCEGSGVYGVPRPIELFIGISETMDKFREFCEKEKTGSPKKSRLDDPAKLSSPCPQVENGSFSDNECNVTQRGFATQVPHTLSTDSSLVEGSEEPRLNHRICLQPSSKSEVTAGTGCQKKANSPTKSPKAKSGILEFAKENTVSSGKTKGKASNNAHDLLLLLSDKQISKPTKPTKPVTLPPVTLRTEVKGSRADQQGRLIPKAAGEFRIEENDSKTIEPSDGVNGEKPQEAESLEERLGINGAVVENSDLQVDNTLSTWTTSHGSRPISSREVGILKDQVLLLDRQDSWIPAEPGQREPVANIPIATLQKISDLAERRARQILKSDDISEQIENRTSLQAILAVSEHGSESNCDSEPEVPFCSEEWPSSPPLKFHEELPPNSSSAIPLGTNNPQREDSEGVLVSTAIQREEQILQVERTPYTNGYALLNTSMNPKSHILSTKSNSISTSENLNDSANHKTPYSDSKTDGSISEASASTPLQDLKPGNNRDAIEGSSRNLDLDLVDRQVQDAIDSQSRNEDVEMANQDIQGVIYNEFQSQSGSPIQETAPASVENIEQLRASLPGNSDQDVSDSCNKRNSEKTKRKSCHVDNQSSHFAKRQKFVKSPKSFNFTQDPQCVSDPSAIGSKNRQEFFECRKRSGTNPPKEDLFRSRANSRITTLNCESKAQLDDRQFVLPANHEATMDSPCSPPPNSQSFLEEGVDSRVKADKMETFNSKSHADNASSRFTANDGSSLQKDGQLIFDKLPVPAILGSGCQDSGSINARNDTVKILAGEDAVEELNIYNRFKATYPDYSAPVEQFVAICKRIENLVKEDRMEHQSLWDDFIIRHKTEYPKYLHRCAEMAEDPAVYEKFYRNEIDEPRYIRRIVTPRSLHEALLLRNQIASCKVQHSHHQLGDIKERQLFPEKLAMMEPRNLTRASSIQMSSPSQPIIDLTGNREFSPTVEKRSRLLSSKNFSPRSIPWVKSNGASSKEASIGTHDRPSQSPHKAILTPPYPNARITKSPPLSKPSSTRSISSAKELSNVSHFEQGHKIDPVKERSSTGIKQTLSESETQAESLDEQRRLDPASGKGIDHQMATSPFAVHKLPEHQGSHKPSSIRPDPASSESPLFLSESASTKSKSAEAPQPWWKDEQSPFNTFFRAYTGIRAGNGNSFAMANHSKSNESRGAGKRTQMLEKIDVSRWWI